MRSLYHERGLWRGVFRPPLWHVRECLRNPAYRALHLFHRKLRGLPRYTTAVVQFQRRPIRLCDAPSFLSAWDEIFVNRIYEIPVMSGAVPTLVDVGANIGLAALFWKWRYGEFHYFGMEPDPAIAGCCRENLRAWGVAGNLVEVAAARQNGTVKFVPDAADGGRMAREHEVGANKKDVEARRLSALLPPSVDLLKIDVEGAEADVLADVGPCLARVRALFVEWHCRSQERGLADAIALLERAGFDCYIQVAGGPAQPFIPSASDGPFTQNLNVYAVRP